MKLKSYKDFINESVIKPWIYKGNFEVTEDMVIDGKLIKEKMPDEIIGTFDCSHMDLTTLEGLPYVITDNLTCYNNKITTLKEYLFEIKGSIQISYNNLTSLEGLPKEINGSFSCNNNNLITLKGLPNIVNGYLDIRNNNLKSLEYISTYIRGNIGSAKNYNNLIYENKFVKSDFYNDINNYWTDLLMYMSKEKISLEEVEGWPEGFLDSNIGKSAKSIGKFNL